MSIIEQLQRRLRLQRITIAGLISLSAAISIGLMAFAGLNISAISSGLLALAVLCLAGGLYYNSGSFSLPPSHVIVRYLDRTYPMFEDSSSLYMKQDLNRLEALQLRRIDQNRRSSGEKIRLPKKRLIRSALLSVALLGVTSLFVFLMSQTGDSIPQAGVAAVQLSDESVNQEAASQPAIESIQITVEPPEYTQLQPEIINSGSVTAAAMSSLSWSFEISGDVTDAALIFNDRNRVELASNRNRYSAEMTAENRLIYRISASSGDTTIFSNYYSIDVTEDRPPQFRITEPSQMRTLLTETNRKLDMSVEIMDDYGMTDASLNATLARGSGESVRFREQRMEFDRVSGLGTRSAEATISLHADSLGMTPGDELYIYVEALDNHPESQVGRSDTYMIVVEDTTRTQSIMAGNIVIDLMPEDFRSQRQIIVDTEGLISDKSGISDEQFELRSRRIGRDQEMLMLEFGHYLGMEDETAESGMGMAEAGDDHAGHDHESGAELDGEGQQATQSTAASLIPEEFFHDHGSPEMNTLFAESPRALLRRALNEMFQASRYLLTDQPEEALAYEYRALEFLQEAQQADRRYVRRAGLDGIPIPVDEKRLTGEVDDFANPRNSVRADRTLPPLVLLEQQIREGEPLNDQELIRVNEAIRQANMSESDKLYLLNRLDRLSSSGEMTEAREQLLTKLTEINANRQRNPSPVRVPAFKAISGNR